MAEVVPLFPRRFQLPVSFGLNLLLSSSEHVLWREVANGTVQANVVVMLNVAGYEEPRIDQRERVAHSDALALQRLGPPLAGFPGSSW